MIRLHYTIDQINRLLNVLNNPHSAPTMLLAEIITDIQQQVSKEIEASKDDVEVKNVE